MSGMSLRLGLGLGSQRGAGANYDAAAKTYFAAMAVQPSDKIKAIYNALIVGLKATTIWAKLDVLQLYLTAHNSAADTLFNVINPAAYNASLAVVAPNVTTPVFTLKAGFTTKGTANAVSYIDTGFIPYGSTNYGASVDNSMFGVYLHTAIGAGALSYYCSINDSTVYCTISKSFYLINSNGSAYYYTSTDPVMDEDNDKFFAVMREPTTANKIIVATDYVTNPYSPTTGTKASNGIPNPAGAIKSFVIGGKNNDGSFTNAQVAKPGAFYAGKGLTAAEWETFKTLLNTYVTAMVAL